MPWALGETHRPRSIHDYFDVSGKLIDIAPAPCCAGFCHFYEAEAEASGGAGAGVYLVTLLKIPTIAGTAGGRLAAALKQPIVVQHRCGERIRPHLRGHAGDYCGPRAGGGPLIHESGAAQMEINFLHGMPSISPTRCFCSSAPCAGPLLATASIPTFMAKPLDNERVPPCTSTQSLEDMDSSNLFSTSEGGNSDLFMHFIAGLQKYTGSDRSVGAERQLLPPPHLWRGARRSNVQWGGNRTTCGLRVPFSEPAHAGSRTASPVPMPIRIWLWPPPWPAATSACWRSSGPCGR